MAPPRCWRPAREQADWASDQRQEESGPPRCAAARAVTGVQVRFATPVTSEEYVARELWRYATLAHCPWHPAGGCGFSRHGTYERVRPPGALIARWRCRLAGSTVSALPDCLASHYSGTLSDLEAMVRIVEAAPSRAAAADELRTEIELPGALRYLDRLCNAVHGALAAIRGLEPALFANLAPTLLAFATQLGTTPPVLIPLRSQVARYLPQLPTPFGFDPRRRDPCAVLRRHPQRTGPDPPFATLDAAPAGRSTA